MNSHKDPSEKLSVSRPSTANEASEDTATETADDGYGVGEKALGDKPQEDNPIAPVTTNDPVYLEGLPLVLVVAAVTLVCFLVLLDNAILATVRIPLGPERRWTSLMSWMLPGNP